MVPNNSPISDTQFNYGDTETDDDYKDDVTNKEKMKDLAFVANGKNMSKFNGMQNSEVKWLDNGAKEGKGQELLRFLRQTENKLNPKKNVEVNWFTTKEGKQVQVNLPTIHTTSKDKETRIEKITEEEGENVEGHDTTLVHENSDDTDCEGGVTIPVSERK